MHHHVHVSLRQIGTALLICMALIAAGATYRTRAQTSTPTSKTSPATLTDVGQFEAAVYAGPDKGLSLRGTLKLRATKTGALTGLLVPKHGATIPLSGQLTGYAINLVFYLGTGKHVFGVGTIGQDPGAKQWVLGGPLVGPKKGDSGDWGVEQDTDELALAFGNVLHNITYPPAPR